MKEKLPTVSVIIPAKGAGESLRRALDSIVAQTYPNIIEVIVAAADATSAAAARNIALVLDNPSGSTPAGLNIALAASHGDVIVRCDAQAVLPPTYVEQAVGVLLRTNAEVVGGMQVPIGSTRWGEAIAAAMSSRWGAGDARYRIGGAAGPVETVYLGVFRRRAFEMAGVFDESFARTQDYELNHRVTAAGGVVWFDPSLKVEYKPRESLGALARQYHEYGMAKRLFAARHRGSLRARQVAPPILAALLILGGVGSIRYPMLLLMHLAYVLALLAAGVGKGTSPFRIGLALATMHLSWGLGFLRPRQNL